MSTTTTMTTTTTDTTMTEIVKVEDHHGTSLTYSSIRMTTPYLINQYYYDILDQEQHCILFDRATRNIHWPIVQVHMK